MRKLQRAPRHTHAGYTVLRGIISPAWIEELRDRFERLSDEEGRLGGLEVMPEEKQQQLLTGTQDGQVPGVRRLGDVVNKGACFDAIWQHPVLLTVVGSVLPGPFKLHSLNGHDPRPSAATYLATMS